MKSQKKKSKKEQPATLEGLREMHRKKWEKYVKRGVITPQQAYTLAAMERFVEEIFILGYIDFPHDKHAIHRVRSFMDAWLDREASYDEKVEPSYLLDETEDFIFVAAGLRYGTESSTEKDTLSAIFMTEQRLFVFDNVEDDPAPRKANLPPLVGVTQAPLNHIRHITLKRESEHFPYGSFELCYQMPQRLVQYFRDTLELILAKIDDPKMTEEYHGRMDRLTGLKTYELEIRSPNVQEILSDLLSVLREVGSHEGFTITNEFEKTDF